MVTVRRTSSSVQSYTWALLMRRSAEKLLVSLSFATVSYRAKGGTVYSVKTMGMESKGVKRAFSSLMSAGGNTCAGICRVHGGNNVATSVMTKLNR